MKNLQTIIESNLRNRTNDQLKRDVKEAMKSEDENSNVIFVFALNVLEERLSVSEYELFEDSL